MMASRALRVVGSLRSELSISAPGSVRAARLSTTSSMGGGGSLKIVAISGSLRKASFNTGLIRAASDVIKEENLQDIELEHVQISGLPMLNTDLERDGVYPEPVEDFRARILAADAVLFASPEYNYSVTAPLKNALDWASRAPNVWAGKPAAILSAGAGFGGGRSQYHLRQIGVYLDLHFINKPELFVMAFQPPKKFDEDGNLIDAATKGRVKAIVLALRDWTMRLQQKQQQSISPSNEI